MTQAPLPAARAALVDSSGVATPAFYRFFAQLQRAQNGNPSADEIAAINAQLAELQAEIDALSKGGSYPVLQVLGPLVSNGLLQNGFAQLRWNGNTDDVPEGARLYFTGARSYAAAKAQLHAGPGITITPDDGAQTLTLAANQSIDGGGAAAVYTASQRIDGGGASG